MLKSFLKADSIRQFGRFVVTGIINTGIDMGLLAFLMWITGQDKGLYVLLFTTFSFLVATTNSYFMNKYWTFGNKAKKKQQADSDAKDYGQFILVTVGGWLINSGLTSLLGTFVAPFFGLAVLNEWIAPDKLQKIWVLFAKALATGVSLIWNFVGYKFLVFKK